MAMDPTSGSVLAMVGGVGEGGRNFNRAERPDLLEERPPASTFKPILYLAALESGLRPESVIDAGPLSIPMPGGKRYRPKNIGDKRYGQITLADALVGSVNTAAVRLLYELKLEPVRQLATRLGIETMRNDDPNQWSLALGTVPTPLTQMVGAYGVFANGGLRVHPHGLVAIYDREGEVVWKRPDEDEEEAANAGRIRELNAMLAQVLKSGTGAAKLKGFDLGDGRRFAGKTGTGSDGQDLWFIGYSSALVTGVWLGNDTPRTLPSRSGGNRAAPVWRAFMEELQRHRVLAGELEPLY